MTGYLTNFSVKEQPVVNTRQCEVQRLQEEEHRGLTLCGFGASNASEPGCLLADAGCPNLSGRKTSEDPRPE